MNTPLLDPAASAAATTPAALTAIEPEPAWRAAAQRCAAVAAQFADAVDSEARFPAEAFAALRRERLLSAIVPAAYGL